MSKDETQSPEHDQWREYIPKQMSQPCADFLDDHIEMAQFLTFVHSLVFTEGPAAWKLMGRQQQLMFQMILCRAVDRYLAYISGLMALTFATKPGMLKSKEATITLEEVLQHDDMDELVEHVVEKRVYALAQMGMSELVEKLQNNFGFHLFDSDDKVLSNAVRVIELRNLITHNRAVVNRRFLSRLSDYSANIGDELKLDEEQTIGDISFLMRSVYDIETRAGAKFGIPQQVSDEFFRKRFETNARYSKSLADALEKVVAAIAKLDAK